MASNGTTRRNVGTAGTTSDETDETSSISQGIMEEEARNQVLVKHLPGFRYRRILGKGSFGKVVKISNENKTICYALKISHLNRLAKKRTIGTSRVKKTRNEAKYLERARGHPNIISLVNSFKSSIKWGNYKHVFFFLVLEFCDGKNLAHYINVRKPSKSFLTEREVIKQLNNKLIMHSILLYIDKKFLLTSCVCC